MLFWQLNLPIFWKFTKFFAKHASLKTALNEASEQAVLTVLCMICRGVMNAAKDERNNCTGYHMVLYVPNRTQP